MVPRRLGTTELNVSPIGYGAFKIGRNEGIKYPEGYDLPDDDAVSRLLNGVLDLGITLIDTAPAYGTSEERIGRAISHRRDAFILSTKVGETFEHGASSYDFSRSAVMASIERSLKRLRADVLDLVFIHSDGQIESHDAAERLHECVASLQSMRDRGLVRAIGMSGKTVAGAEAALEWADAIMVEYHLNDQSHEDVMREAVNRGVGVFVKKGLASGHLAAQGDPAEAIRFVLSNPAVSSLIIGGLNIDHIRANIAAATSVEV